MARAYHDDNFAQEVFVTVSGTLSGRISERLHGRVSAASKLDEVGLQETVPKWLRGRGMTRLRKGSSEGCRQPSETGSHGKVPERLRKPFGRTPRDQTQNTLEGREWLLHAVKPETVLALKPLPVHLPVHLPEALPALEGECVLWDVLYVFVPPRLRGAGSFIRQAHSTPGCFVCLRGCFGGSLWLALPTHCSVVPDHDSGHTKQPGLPPLAPRPRSRDRPARSEASRRGKSLPHVFVLFGGCFVSRHPVRDRPSLRGRSRRQGASML